MVFLIITKLWWQRGFKCWLWNWPCRSKRMEVMTLGLMTSVLAVIHHLFISISAKLPRQSQLYHLFAIFGWNYFLPHFLNIFVSFKRMSFSFNFPKHGGAFHIMKYPFQKSRSSKHLKIFIASGESEFAGFTNGQLLLWELKALNDQTLKLDKYEFDPKKQPRFEIWPNCRKRKMVSVKSAHKTCLKMNWKSKLC